MFNKDEKRKYYLQLGLDPLQIEELLIEDQYIHRNEKEGENVIGLTYHGDILSDEEFAQIERQLQPNNFLLSYADVSTALQANAFESVSHFLINTNVTEEIIKNVAWDVLSFTIEKVWQVTKKQVRKTLLKSGKTFIIPPAGTAVSFHLLKTVNVTFYFGKNLPKNAFAPAIKQIPDVLKRVKEKLKKEKYDEDTRPALVNFKATKHGWKYYDPFEQRMKKIAKNQKEQKKETPKKKGRKK